MPDPTPTSNTIPTLLNKQTQAVLNTLLTGALTLSTTPVDAADIDELVDTAGNALSELAEDASSRDYLQAQQQYTLAKEVQNALRVITHEPPAIDDLAIRETASTAQLSIVGTQALSPVAFAFPNGAALTNL